MQRNIPQVLLTAAVIAFLPGNLARADALAKRKPDKLEAVHQAVKARRAKWRNLPRRGPYLNRCYPLYLPPTLGEEREGG